MKIISFTASIFGLGLVCATVDAQGTSQVVTIEDIQGSGFISPLNNQVVTVDAAIVTAIFNDGFAMQQASTDSTRSSGIIVNFSPTQDANTVAIGDEVDVTGTVRERFNETQLFRAAVSIISSGNSGFAPTPLSLPTADLLNYEQLEGMLVSIIVPSDNSLVVSENFQLGRFGEFRACSASNSLGRIFQFAQLNSPDVDGFAAFQEELGRTCVTVDDDNPQSNPDPILAGGLYPITTAESLRGGAKILTLVGVLRFTFSQYRIPTKRLEDLVFEDRNDGRHDAFENSGSLPPVNKLKKSEFRLVVSNLFNYFTSIDFEGTTPNRGANDFEEFLRQEEKVIGSLADLDADILAFDELENTISNSAAVHIVRKLNGLQGSYQSNNSRRYAAVSVEEGFNLIGSQVIKNDIIYDTKRMRLVGAAILTDDQVDVEIREAVAPFSIFAQSRAPLAATFTFVNGGGKGGKCGKKGSKNGGKGGKGGKKGCAETQYVTIVNNHYKSRRSQGAEGVETDQLDGASSWNNLRTRTSEAILKWLETNPTNSPSPENVIFVGDLNSYAKETPITTLTDGAGYVNTEPPASYSFIFSGQSGTLDYILVSPSMVEFLRDSFIWHVNTDEPNALDYNLENRNPNIFDATVPFRFSDHDPLVASFEFEPYNALRISLCVTMTTTMMIEDVFSDELADWMYGDNGQMVPRDGSGE